MIASTAPLTIAFRADLHVLIVRWLREVSTPELQQGYQAVLAAAQEHHVSHWLVDSRRRNQSNASMVEWLDQEFLPASSQQLKQTAHLACLTASSWQPAGTPATPLAELARRTSPSAGRGFVVQLFGDEGAAIKWLKAHQ
ncbi:STAS/SEC14 domain-containing protein [Hymenobacter tenuis]